MTGPRDAPPAALIQGGTGFQRALSLEEVSARQNAQLRIMLDKGIMTRAEYEAALALSYAYAP
jgi:membrane peptidoglycan carboxypeptidase